MNEWMNESTRIRSSSQNQNQKKMSILALYVA